MLIEKSKEGIVIMKLVNSDEIVVEVKSTTDTEYIVKNPFLLIMAQTGMQFSPMLIMADPEAEVSILKSTVVAKASPSKSILSSYEKSISKIVMPSKPGVII